MKSYLLIALVLLLLGIGTIAVTLRKTDPNPIGCSPDPTSLTGVFKAGSELAVFNNQKIPVPGVLADEGTSQVLGAVSPQEHWVEVSLKEQKLRAWDQDKLVLETNISSGLPWAPTPKGEYRIWAKFRYAQMEGGQGAYYYNLPNVPYVMYFSNTKLPNYLGYGLHGTYWHNNFGKPQSQGCVNLSTTDAERLYDWTTPYIPVGKNFAYATPGNPGTKILIHD